MDILTEFGIDWKLLLAQIVNFAILLFVLKKILYKPILAMLEERKQKIAESIKNSEEIEKRLEKIESEREKTIQKASEEAMKILDDATKTSAQIVEEAREKASEELAAVVTKARTQIESDRQKMQTQLREELSDLVATAMTAVYSKKLTKADQDEIIKSTVRQMTKS